MTFFEEMLMPFGRRVSDISLPGGIDLNEYTVIQMLDNQEVLETNVLYLGTPKMAAGIADGLVRVEPSCFVVIASANSLGFKLPASASRIGFAQVQTSLAGLFNHITSFLRSMLHPHTSADSPDHPSFQSIWHDIMEQNLTSTESVRATIQTFYPDLKLFVSVMLVRFEKPADADRYIQLILELRNILPHAIVERYKDQIVLLTSRPDRLFSPLLPHEIHMQLEDLMERYQSYMIIGNGFRQLSMLRTNVLLCDRALAMSEHLRLMDTARVNTYDRFSMYCVIDLAAQQYVRTYSNSDIIYLIHPAVIQITRYDRMHATNLRDTLFYYLLHSRNLARTAAATFMHRNTVMNRINKIVELTGIDFEDGGLCQRLTFSCQLIQYYERVLNLPLKLGNAVSERTPSKKGIEA